MNRTELEKYKAILLAKQAELSGGLRNRDEILIEKTPDALDEVQLAGERELAIRNLDREASLLRNVRAALFRINDGSYGVCLHCEEDIKPKRLEAVPWAAFCIRCQEAVDRHDPAMRDRAHVLLEQAITMRPDYAQAHYILGIWNVAFGSRPAAIRQFKIALNLHPDWPEVRQKLEQLETPNSAPSTPIPKPNKTEQD